MIRAESREPFAVVFAAVGITHREASYFHTMFQESGARERTVSFLNLADDPTIERLLTPRLALTTAEYLAFKAQIALARQGRDLLKEKRKAMMQEFMGAAEDLMEKGEALERSAALARCALALAVALDGEETIISASFAARREASIGIDRGYVMGVGVPKIERENFSRSLLERGYGVVGTSARMDEVARRFEEELSVVVEVAAHEAMLRRLAAEIQRTSRRVNTLENVTLPRLAAQGRLIQATLEEREREDLFRLKRVKQKIYRQKHG